MKSRIQFASDVVRDGMGVELLDENHKVVAELFRSDVTGSFHLNTFGNDVPISDVRSLFDAAAEREGLSFSIPSEEVTVIYVELLDESTKVYRPVLAHCYGENEYRIDPFFSIPEGEVWAFLPGTRVRCEARSDGSPVAVVAVESQSEQGVTPNRSLPLSLNPTSSVRGSEDF